VMRARPHPTDPNKCFWDKYTFKLAPIIWIRTSHPMVAAYSS
jgi:hypothetical protein